MMTKKFDSVKMMRDIRTKVTEELKDLTPEELVKYLNTRYPEFDKNLASADNIPLKRS